MMPKARGGRGHPPENFDFQLSISCILMAFGELYLAFYPLNFNSFEVINDA